MAAAARSGALSFLRNVRASTRRIFAPRPNEMKATTPTGTVIASAVPGMPKTSVNGKTKMDEPMRT